MLWELIRAGLIALQDYIALHVVTCLIPAFLLAGAMVTFRLPRRRSSIIWARRRKSSKRLRSLPAEASSWRPARAP